MTKRRDYRQATAQELADENARIDACTQMPLPGMEVEEPSQPIRDEAIDAAQITWRELSPNGRCIFYEGDDPDTFVEQVKAEFGFDPTTLLCSWGCWTHRGQPPIEMWSHGRRGFHCPPEHLDAIYGSGRWRMGS